jgi:hypothetical protein
MKIHFTVSFRGAEQNKEIIHEILNKLNLDGHKTTLRPFGTDETISKERIDKVKNLIDIKPSSSATDIYKLTLKRIREADVIISESTVASSGVGYEVAMAQSEKKPILALHNSGSSNSLAQVFSGNQTKIFKVAKYTSTDEALSHIGIFLEDAKQSIDTKFILIISPEIDNYLNWAGEERRLHKAQIVRNAVEDVMKKDKEYQDFLKERDF